MSHDFPIIGLGYIGGLEPGGESGNRLPFESRGAWGCAKWTKDDVQTWNCWGGMRRLGSPARQCQANDPEPRNRDRRASRQWHARTGSRAGPGVP